ncbi:carbohydrate kinase family protein [Xylanivirga thermophila]|uniref:carbohydrate kinase family protein n=1 Tax=Xylanivirga thermophila TaxID=2496273 RepID=UPI00101D0EAF|nr:carbohydrate kinase [Xylanivirga thermophila]
MGNIEIKDLKDKKYDIATVGEVLVDMISTEYTDGFDCDTYRRFFGGSPANIAMNVKKLGINSTIICCAGSDEMGDFLISKMKMQGLDTSNVKRAYSSTSMVLLNKSQSSPIPIFYRGADYRIVFDESIEDVIRTSKIVHFSTWPISREPSRSAIEKIIEVAKESGTIIGFDPNYHPALWEKGYDGVSYIKGIIKDVDIIKPSEDDAKRLFGEESIDEYIARFLDLGAKLVIMTLGKDGLVASDGKTTIRMDSVADNVMDTTGAGDAFWSGFYAAIVKGYDVKDAIRLGNASSAYKLRYTGAVVDFPSIDRLKDLYEI